MADMNVFLDALDTHLEDKGFHAHLSRAGKDDGHSLRTQISEIRASPGSASPCSAPVYVKNLLQAMNESQVPEWTSDKACSALEAAGFDPHHFLK